MSRAESASRAPATARPVASNVAPGSWWAPPTGSGTISSITPCSMRSGAVSLSARAASSLWSQLRHRIDEHDSGEMTEYHEFSSMSTRSPTPIPSAPPEAPSPITTTTMGTGSRAMTSRFRAMASAWPRSSASSPG